jgi:hypothetical protein
MEVKLGHGLINRKPCAVASLTVSHSTEKRPFQPKLESRAEWCLFLGDLKKMAVRAVCAPTVWRNQRSSTARRMGKRMTKTKKMIAALAMTTAMGAGQAMASDPEACQTVRFSDVGWTDITATTATASVIL